MTISRLLISYKAKISSSHVRPHGCCFAHKLLLSGARHSACQIGEPVSRLVLSTRCLGFRRNGHRAITIDPSLPS